MPVFEDPIVLTIAGLIATTIFARFALRGYQWNHNGKESKK